METLREEHERGPVDVLERAEEGVLLGRESSRAGVEIHDRDVRRHRRGGERCEDGVRQLGWHLALADAVPLHLPVERPAGCPEGVEPEVFQLGPVGVANGDAAETEEAALVEPVALVQEEDEHGAEETLLLASNTGRTALRCGAGRVRTRGRSHL